MKTPAPGTPSIADMIGVLMDVQQRVTRLESTAATQLGQGRENVREIQQLRKLVEERIQLEGEVQRLQAQKSAIFEMVGRMRVAQRLSQDLPVDRAVFVADLDRALAEMGRH